MSMLSLRVCDICGGIDSLPRHVIGHGPGEAPTVRPEIFLAVIGNLLVSDEIKASAVANLGDTTLELRHIACCAAAGCPAGTCTKD